ncbi:UNVERIFIED_ORG: tail length tape measure protein [Burkholderia sp. CF145]
MASMGSLGLELYANSSRLEGDMGRAAQIVESRARAMDAAAAKAAKSIEGIGKAAGSVGRINGIKEAANDAEHLGHTTTAARRELLVLAHELSQGNFKRFGGSLMVLGEQMDWMGKIMSPTGMAIGLVTGAALLAATAFIKGAHESAQFAMSIRLTGNYAGLTEGQFNAMAKSVAAGADVTIKHAREMTQEFVSTGRFSGLALETASVAAARLADMTGQKSEEIVKDFTKMTDGVLKWALEANKQYHFVDVALYEHIKALEKQGKTEEAEVLALEALNKHLIKTQENLGYLQAAWHGVGQMASWTWDKMLGWGRSETLDDRIAAIKDQLEALPKSGSIMGGVHPAGWVSPREQLEAALRDAVKKKMREEDNALLTQQKAGQNERDVTNRQFYDKLIEDTKKREQKLQDEIKDINRRADESHWSPEMRAKALAAAREKFKDTGLARADLGAQLQPLQAQITAEDKLLTQREQALQVYYKNNKLSIEGFYDTERIVIEAHTKRVGALYDQQIAIQENYAKKATNAATRTEALTKAHDLADRKEAALSADREKLAMNTEAMTRDTDTYRESVERLNAILAGQQGQSAVTAGSEFDRQNRALLERARAQGDTGTLDTAARVRANAESIQLVNNLKTDAAEIEKRLNLQLERENNLVESGQKSRLQGMADMDNERAVVVQQLDAIAQRMQQAADTSGLESLQGETDGLRRHVEQLQQASHSLGKTFDDIFASGFANMIEGAISGTKTFRQLFLDMANSIEQAIARIVAQDLAARLFGIGGGASGGGLIGQLVGLLGSSGGAGAAAAGAGVQVGGAIDMAMPVVTAALASGGPTSAGSLYQVAENGPELLNVANKTYLMMGNQSGRVTPMGSEAMPGRQHIWNMHIAVPPGTTRQTAQQQAREIMTHAQIAMARNS